MNALRNNKNNLELILQTIKVNKKKDEETMNLNNYFIFSSVIIE